MTMQPIPVVIASLTAALFLQVADVATAGGKANTAVHSAVQALVNEMAQTRNLLHHADHDYSGHRAAAVNDITRAMHVLHPHHKHTLGTRTVRTGNGGGNREPQAVSDAQLRQAEGQLQVILNQLGQIQGHPHAGQAANDIQLARGQLARALAIR